MSKSRQKTPSRKTTNQLRIIAGKWRGRKLSFPSVEGLRPTPDRVRETLFNWLSPSLADAHCLDLFAGSGALGLEALSRAAAHVDLVDSSADASQQLLQNLQLLNTSQGHVWQDNAENWLRSPRSINNRQRYDIIFLDPPFHKGLANNCISAIDEQQLLAEQSWLYLEMAIDEPPPVIPDHWRLHREKTAGQVCYRLFSID